MLTTCIIYLLHGRYMYICIYHGTQLKRIFTYVVDLQCTCTCAYALANNVYMHTHMYWDTIHTYTCLCCGLHLASTRREAISTEQTTEFPYITGLTMNGLPHMCGKQRAQSCIPGRAILWHASQLRGIHCMTVSLCERVLTMSLYMCSELI